MKKFIAVIIACMIVSGTQAQILNAMKEKANNGANNLLNGSKKDKDKNNSNNNDQNNNNTNNSNNDNSNSGNNNSNNNNSNTTPQFKEDPLTTYSKFDFVPGDKILFYEDFSQDVVGEFPKLWYTNATGDIVTTNQFPGNWFKMKQGGVFNLEKNLDMPENAMIEFDLIAQPKEGETAIDFTFILFQMEPSKTFAHNDTYPGTGVKFYFTGEHNSAVGYLEYATELLPEINSSLNTIKVDKVNHFSIWIQGQRIRLYIDQTKVFDAPRVLYPNVRPNRMEFSLWGCQGEPLVSNFRISSTQKDSRSKFLTDGKLISYGILFDSGSDKLKPQSYGSLKEMAEILKANATVKVKIVGHTDGDGDDASNLALSKKRAEAVKNALNKDFAIDLTRMETDGKGETQPIGNNTSLEGKAQNRRVEFIKQ